MPMKIPTALKLTGVYVLTAAFLAGPSRGDTNRVNRPCSRQALLGSFVGPALRSLSQGKGLGLCSFFPAFPNAAAARGHKRGSQHARVPEQSRGAPLSQAFLRR